MIANTFLENNKIINIIFNYIFRLTLFSKNVFASANIIYNQCYSLYVQYSQLFPPLAAKLALHQGFIVIHFQFISADIKKNISEKGMIKTGFTGNKRLNKYKVPFH